jgi:hypothetical protein
VAIAANEAINKVRELMATLRRSDNAFLYRCLPVPFPSDWEHALSELREQVPFIRAIARQVDPTLEGRFEWKWHGGLSWPYAGWLMACEHLVGELISLRDGPRILGAEGPQLIGQDLRPWIWGAAKDFLANGHYPEAVQAAASAVFDHHLPQKLGISWPKSTKDLAAQAFKKEAPSSDWPRLRLGDYPEGSADWISQQGRSVLRNGLRGGHP